MERIIDKVNEPKDLKNLKPDELQQLAEEIRELLIDTVTQTGGHLASNLGVVELTLALHKIFDSPRDKIIWDVGHQSYVHKLVTGRKGRFDTIRQYRGLSGFPDPGESPHDPFGTGHASTSVSAALGLATARDLKGEDHHVVAVIGDGAMTGGLAFEGINNAGHLGTRLIVVLNENQMSISPNVGALAKYLNRLRADPRYHSAKAGVEHALLGVPLGRGLLQALKRLKNSLKGLVIRTMLWEELGFTYIGPIDGHDIDQLCETLTLAKVVQRPVMVHVISTKGKGYFPAEQDAIAFHGIPPNGSSKSSAPSYTRVFGDTVVKIAQQDSRVVAITAAMREGTGLDKFAASIPERFFDVGIAEQHAVTFAAGMAMRGVKPIVAIYSTFLQRAYDQLVHDVCSQNLPIVFCLDRAGIVGDDGRTHQGTFDLSYLRHLPNMTVMVPKDENELQHVLWTAMNVNGPVAIRYPRGAGVGVKLDEKPHSIRVGEGEVLRTGRDVAILAVGSTVHPALRAAEMLEKKGIQATVVNARFVKPLDVTLIVNLASRIRRLVTVEENILAGGFGSAVLELLEERRITGTVVKRIGLPDEFVEHATQQILREKFSLTADGIAKTVLNTYADLGGRSAPIALEGAS
ncbi:MAG: 1-deoxy-D-xylulose-5-phosphate synthase [Chloroflexi bacterium]|nr:1-deoxy-D-xylulose-5-phosphate synthase [Chloroflexota bacterium]